MALLLPSLLRAQTLQHRYSFVSDASDSVGGANGTLNPGSGGNPATINNGLMLPGNPGGGNGVSGYVSLPTGILAGDNSVSIECWLTQSAQNNWAEAWDFGNNGSQNFALIPFPVNNNTETEVAFTPNGGENDLRSDVPFPTGVEEHVVVTYNDATLTADLFTNGALDSFQVLPNNSYSPGRIGGAGGTTLNTLGNDVYGDPQFGGAIYEFRIWNGALSQRQISADTVLGPSVLVTNLTVNAATLTAGAALKTTDTEQANVTVHLPQTGSSAIQATLDATNWTSANTNVVTVSSGGLITGVGAGTTTVSCTVGGVAATSGSITVTPFTLAHRYSFVSDASDSVGGANGTLVGPTTGAAATINNGLVLPGSGGGFGTSGYVSLPAGILAGYTSATIECWMTQNQGATWAEVWDFGNNNGNGQFQNFSLIPDDNVGNTRAAFGPNQGEVDVTAPPIASGSEQYVAVTYNNSSLQAVLYTNGVIYNQNTLPSTFYSPGSIGGPAGTSENMLGNDVYGDNQFNGTVYEFRIWNGAVSPVYVAVSAAAGPGVIVTNTTPSALVITITNFSLLGAQTEQATVTGTFSAAPNVNVTDGVNTWASSDPSVLTVSSTGLITGISGGTATVTATVNGVSITSAAITVADTIPNITLQPVPVSAVVGESATFTTSALGGGLTFQWLLNSDPILGATNTTLTLTNLQLSQSGGLYSVKVSNTLGSTNSVAVALTVSQAILAHRYSFVSDASDSIGGANGTLIAGSGGTPATINNGLTLPGNPGGGNGVSGYVALPNNMIAGYDSITVECWLTQASQNTWAEPWDFGTDGSHNFALIPYPNNNGNNMEVAFTPHGNELDLQSSVAFPTGTEQYVVVTYNDAILTADLYTNGQLEVSRTFPDNSYSPGRIDVPPGTTDNSLGNDVYGDPQFGGTIYEFRVWNGAVSPLYISLSQAAGPSSVVTDLTPTTVSVSVTNTTMLGQSTQQATATGNFAVASGVNVTGSVTNWSSSDTSVLEVSSTGLITAVGGGSATISATVNGTTGASASITVPLTAPSITIEPEASETILVGGTFQASVAVDGIAPFFYHWFLNNGATPVAGQTSATLLLTDVQPGQAGSYTCVISNAYGHVTSSATVLTVVTPTTYQKNLLSLAPLAYWPLDETTGTIAFDVAGGHNGAYIGGVTLGQGGPTNGYFGGSSLSANFDGASGYVDIPEGPFNILGPISIITWVNMSAPPAFSDLIGHGDASWRIAINGGAGQPAANDGGGQGDATGPTSLVDGNWHMVAYTYDGSSGGADGVLYVDGVAVANNTITVAPAGDNLDVWIGGAPDYGTTFPAARLFAGNIANVSVFDSALTAADIEGLFNGQVPVTISFTQPTPGSLTLTWSAGVLLQSTNVTGPWTTNSAAVSPFTTPIGAGNEFYKVVTP